MKILDGLIVVDKPSGWTSHDVVNRMRRLCNTKKVGHLGTLDPSATGVLPVVIGRATRLSQFFQRTDKAYTATIQFGFTTDSYDADGTPASTPVPVSLSAELLEPILEHFRGPIIQMPPPISAKKIAGKPAYRLARNNIPFELKAVPVEIYSLRLLACEGDRADVQVHCSTGTYVRSIAHDIGQMLGCGAHLKQLRRTASGGFDLGMARDLDGLAALASADRIEEALIPAAALLPEFPSEQVDAMTAGFIRQGRDFHVSPFRPARGAKYVKAVTMEGELVAIGEARLPHVYHPVLVL